MLEGTVCAFALASEGYMPPPPPAGSGRAAGRAGSTQCERLASDNVVGKIGLAHRSRVPVRQPRPPYPASRSTLARGVAIEQIEVTSRLPLPGDTGPCTLR